MHLSPEQLKKGVLIVTDGGALNNQSEERYGYGTFTVLQNGAHAPSTYDGLRSVYHRFDFGIGTTNNVAELSMLKHAMLYAKELIVRGWKEQLRIGTDSQTALLGATTRVKKPAPHLKPLYYELHEMALSLKDQVQFVKLHEQDVKEILGH
jgi:ribonuclease HI